MVFWQWFIIGFFMVIRSGFPTLNAQWNCICWLKKWTPKKHTGLVTMSNCRSNYRKKVSFYFVKWWIVYLLCLQKCQNSHVLWNLCNFTEKSRNKSISVHCFLLILPYKTWLKPEKMLKKLYGKYFMHFYGSFSRFIT